MWVPFLKTTSQPFADQPPFPALPKTTHRGQCEDGTTHFSAHAVQCVMRSQYGVVPEDTDGLGALLGGDQPELHGDGFVQRVLQQLVVVMDQDTDHRRVDHRALWHPDHNKNNNTTCFPDVNMISASLKKVLIPVI